jgi:hypothetical protein
LKAELERAHLLKVQSGKISARYNCSNLLDLKNLQVEQVRKAFCYQKLFWPFTVWTNCCSDLKIFANSCPSASNFKFLLTVGQTNLRRCQFEIGTKHAMLQKCCFSFRIHKITFGYQKLWQHLCINIFLFLFDIKLHLYIVRQKQNREKSTKSGSIVLH